MQRFQADIWSFDWRIAIYVFDKRNSDVILIQSGRRDKVNYYLDIAESVLTRGTCRRRKFGAVIVNNDRIVSTGYAGAPRGRKNCTDSGICCVREKFNVPRGERYELCRSVHAEANAIISASSSDMLGGAMYLVGKEVSTGNYVQNTAPCAMCKRFIINACIESVYVRQDFEIYRKFLVSEWVKNDESLNLVYGY